MPPTDLLVVADSVEGGLGVAATAHARWFQARGWSTVLVAPGAAVSEAAGAGVRAVALPDAGSALHLPAVLAAARALRSALREHRPRVVHAHGTRSQLLCVLAGRRPFVTMHGAGGRVPGQGRLGSLVRDTGRRLAPLLARSAFSAAPAGAGWETVLHASPRLVELGPVPPPPATPVLEVLWLGRLDHPKDPLLFVRACARAADRVDLHGTVVGDGPLGPEVVREVDRLGAPVTLVGATDAVGPHLERARVVCLFSGFEGVPFSVQEAMWCGRAVLLSPLPSLRWFAADAAAYASDVDEAAAALVALADPAVASARGSAARERVHGLVSPDDPFPRYRQAYGPR